MFNSFRIALDEKNYLLSVILFSYESVHFTVDNLQHDFFYKFFSSFETEILMSLRHVDVHKISLFCGI